MLAWLAPLLVFGLVVFVHELGHFLAAKAVGVYAPRFSIGFGPALWRKRWGETEYVLALLPIGGYVRMASKEDEAIAFIEGGSEQKGGAAAAGSGEVGGNSAPAISGHPAGARDRDWDPEALVPFGPKPVPPNRWFESKPLWARLFIMLAGVSMNVVLAIVATSGALLWYGQPYTPAVIDSIVPDRPAARAGLARGDSVVAVDGRPVKDWSAVFDAITHSPGRDVALEVVRNGTRLTVHVVPELTEVENPETGQKESVGRIGVAATRRDARERIGVGTAFATGWTVSWRAAGEVVHVVRGLVTGEVSVKQLGGPVAIARASVAVAKTGFERLIYLIAALSINLAVLNLLPIPILDGGQILINLLEAAKGSAFSTRTREYILRAGLVAIVLLFVLVMFNDITSLLGFST